MNQFVARDRRQPGPILRDDAEVLEHLLQQLVAFEHRVVDDRQEGPALQLLDDAAAEKRLARPDFAGDHDQRLAPLQRVGHLFTRRSVRRAVEEESRVGGDAERRLAKTEEDLVAFHARGSIAAHSGSSVPNRLFDRYSCVAGPLAPFLL